jgi:hypothetical protein
VSCQGDGPGPGTVAGMTAEPPVTQLSKRERLSVNQLSELGQSDSDRPVHGLTEVVQMTGVSRSTVKRKLAAGAFPNAVQDEHGAWLVSVSDLLAAGLSLVPGPARVAAATPVVRTSEPAQPAPVDQSNRVADLERDLAIERARREAAERVIVHVEKRAETAERALLMLTAGERPADPPATHIRGPESAAEPLAETPGPDAPVPAPVHVATTSAVQAPPLPVPPVKVERVPWSRRASRAVGSFFTGR